MPEWLQPVSNGTLISLRVQPRASKNEIVGERNGALKVRLTSPPADGAANKLCCEFIAKICGVPKRDVSIRSGDKSRRKRLLLTGSDPVSVQKSIEKVMRN